MLPRRERKPKKEKDSEKDKIGNKEKDANSSQEVNKMTFGDRLKIKKLTKPSALLGTVVESPEDPDDPYAFHDAAPDMVQSGMNCTQMSPSVGVSSLMSDTPVRSPHPQTNPTPLQNRPSADSSSGLPKAKLYPELAEKLEKVRPNVESKIPKSRARSSRTMNKLQTKIAQNKIKDKLRKSQESNQSELSPNQVASPEPTSLANVGVASLGIPTVDLNASAGSVGLNSVRLDSLTIPGLEVLPHKSVDMDLRGINIGYSGGSNAAGLLGLDQLNRDSMPSPLVSSRSALPPPYPGLSAHKTLPFSSTAELRGNNQRLSTGSMASVPVTVPSSVPAHSSRPSAQTLSTASASSLTQSPHHKQLTHQAHEVHQQLQQQLVHHQSNHLLPQLLQRNPQQHQQHQQQEKAPAPFSVEGSDHEKYLAPAVDQIAVNRQCENSTAYPQTSAILTSKVGLVSTASHLPTSLPGGMVSPSSDLPPPPPYMPRPVACSVPTTPAAGSSVLFTRPQRLKGLLSEKDARTWLKNDLAVKVYAIYARRRIRNHVFVGSSMSKYNVSAYILCL